MELRTWCKAGEELQSLYRDICHLLIAISRSIFRPYECHGQRCLPGGDGRPSTPHLDLGQDASNDGGGIANSAQSLVQ